MAAYIARDAQGAQVNIVEIEQAQIAEWEALTGLTLEPFPEPEPTDEVGGDELLSMVEGIL